MGNRVLVIGAGWSGIYALKHALEAGLDAECVEEDKYIMGVWHYDRHPGGVIRHTHSTSSKAYLHPSDFPFPESTPEFPHHHLIYDHVSKYVDHFGLRKHIKFKTRVEKVKKVGVLWEVLLSNGKKNIYDYIIVASGQNKVPNYPNDEMYKKFKGKTLHAHHYHGMTKELKGKKVLVVGGGEFAADIAKELCDESEVTMSVRNGQWMQEKVLGADESADMLYNRMMHKTLRWWTGSIFKSLVEWMWGIGGSSIPEWNPGTGYFNAPYNRNREVITLISEGKIKPRGRVTGVKGREVKMKGGNNWEEFDVIIFATGYDHNAAIEYLPAKTSGKQKYKYIFYNDDPSLAFVGYVRPYVGSIFMLCELQSRYIAEVFSERVGLPNKESRDREIIRDVNRQRREFPKHYRRLDHLVNPYDYCDELAKRIGAKPRTFELLLMKPIFWWKLITQPWSPFQWRIYDRNTHKRKVAHKEIEKMYKHPVAVKLRKAVPSVLVVHIGVLIAMFWVASQITEYILALIYGPLS